MSNPHLNVGDDARPKLMTPGELLVLKAHRRKLFHLRSAMQGLAAKEELIRKGKGRNGKSMSQELRDRHAEFAY